MMTEQQGCSIPIDKTPPMGANPIPISNGLAKGQEVLPMTGQSVKYYLIDVKTGESAEIHKFPFTIGRMSTDDLRIRNNKVSRNHAIIDKENDALVLINNSSLNGLKVNDHTIDRVILNDGDEIGIASELYSLEIQDTSYEHITIEDTVIQHAARNIDHLSEDIFEETQNIEETVITSKGNKGKYVIVALLLVSLSVAGLYGYQQYTQYMQESRVFTMSEGSNSRQLGQDESRLPDTHQQKEAEPQKNNAITSVGQNDIGGANKTVNNELTPREVRFTETNKKTASVAAQPTVRKKNSNITTTKPNTKPKPKPSLKRVVLYEHTSSKQKIKNAEKLYHQGKYKESIKALGDIANSKRHLPEYRVIATSIQENINELYALYENGNTSYKNNDKDQAFADWVKLLNNHNLYYPNQDNYFTAKINDIVAGEYEERGNHAYAKNEWRQAYKHWQNSLAIRPKSSVEKSLSLMDAEIKQLYRTGYRYETVNISRAIDYWEALLKKAPRDHEYHIKAAAKVKWYANTKRGEAK